MQEKLRTEGIPRGKKTFQLMVLRKLTKEKNRKKTTGGGCYVLQFFPTQGSNLRFLYLWQWQAYSLPLWYMGNPELSYIHLKKCSPLSYGTIFSCRMHYNVKTANCPIYETFIFLAPPPKIYYFASISNARHLELEMMVTIGFKWVKLTNFHLQKKITFSYLYNGKECINLQFL